MNELAMLHEKMDEQAFWDVVFALEYRDSQSLSRAADAADNAVEIRRKSMNERGERENG